MEKKYKIIALIGPAGSGKDYILNQILAAPGSADLFNEIISATTRPPRQGEIDGKNYHFLTTQEFGEKVLNFEMLEACEFNNWFYGTPLSSLKEDKINIGVFNPEGVYAMLQHPNIEVLKVFYICVNDKIRLLRQLNREENPDIDEIMRRWKTDKNDFNNLEFLYGILYNDTKEKGLFAVSVITNTAKEILHSDKNN